VALVLILGIFLLNVEVSTRQGINYRVRELKIPLYLKLLDFFDRNYNYAHLVKQIIIGSRNEQEEIMKVFEWTHLNIKKNPGSLPVVDDHVWNIIIRGYGDDDQAQDVFATLCNYAGTDAFFAAITGRPKDSKKYFSFVRLGNKWALFDVYNGIYFKNQKDEIAGINDLLSDNWKALSLTGTSCAIDYREYFGRLPSIDCTGYKLKRSSIQSPLRRLVFFLKH